MRTATDLGYISCVVIGMLGGIWLGDYVFPEGSAILGPAIYGAVKAAVGGAIGGFGYALFRRFRRSS